MLKVRVLQAVGVVGFNFPEAVPNEGEGKHLTTSSQAVRCDEVKDRVKKVGTGSIRRKDQK